MVITIIAVALAFGWLLWESKWLTVRLAMPPERGVLDLTSLINIAITVVIGIALLGAFLPIQGIPAYYRRYIERARKNKEDPFWLPDNFYETVKRLKGENSLC